MSRLNIWFTLLLVVSGAVLLPSVEGSALSGAQLEATTRKVEVMLQQRLREDNASLRDSRDLDAAGKSFTKVVCSALQLIRHEGTLVPLVTREALIEFEKNLAHKRRASATLNRRLRSSVPRLSSKSSTRRASRLPIPETGNPKSPVEGKALTELEAAALYTINEALMDVVDDKSRDEWLKKVEDTYYLQHWDLGQYFGFVLEIRVHGLIAEYIGTQAISFDANAKRAFVQGCNESIRIIILMLSNNSQI